jgi:hypothetical protein
MHEGSIGQALERACERAGVGDEVGERFRPLVTLHGSDTRLPEGEQWKMLAIAGRAMARV